MEGHNKVVLAFVLAVLMAGQLVAEAIVVVEALGGTAIVDGARRLPAVPAARGPRKSALLLPQDEGSQRTTAAGVKEDKAYDMAHARFFIFNLPNDE
ncbi:hypothetical protein U9M48_040986 [Paspalum notatum var. saurae]|uniref:Uncharacterized protein n=1 Tax=Paspalum notatum var. saurae TaxID=547442 RepID=A0AAQ3UN08_PASNO